MRPCWGGSASGGDFADYVYLRIQRMVRYGDVVAKLIVFIGNGICR
jgi:hypothetical protein